MKEHGFSLVELLISLCLLSFIITSTAQLIISSFLVKRHAERTLHLAELASTKLERLKSLPFESSELKEGNSVEYYTDETRGQRYKSLWEIREISSRLRMVEIEIFPEKKPQERVRIALLISEDLGF